MKKIKIAYIGTQNMFRILNSACGRKTNVEYIFIDIIQPDLVKLHGIELSGVISQPDAAGARNFDIMYNACLSRIR